MTDKNVSNLSVFEAIADSADASVDIKTRAMFMKVTVNRFARSGKTPEEFATSIDYPLPVIISLINGEIDQFTPTKLVDILIKSGANFLEVMDEMLPPPEKMYTRAQVSEWRSDAFASAAQIATRFAAHDAARYITQLANEEVKPANLSSVSFDQLSETRLYAINYAAENFGMYKVKDGDTLSHIAQRFGTQWEHLAEFNKLENPHLIFPDQILKLR